MTVFQKLLAVLFVLIIGGGLVAVFSAFRSQEPSSGPAKVWSEEHQHWH